MPVWAVVGANWGDEGKGKVVDFMAGEADFVVRYQGGGNAGHTVVNEYGKFALHLLPSGVFYPKVTNVIAPGVALDLEVFLNELDALEARGVPKPRVRVADRVQIVLPYHRLLDEYEEERLGERSFGSTRSGIAPFYADKCLKVGVQVCELLHGNLAKIRIEQSLASKNLLIKQLYGKGPVSSGDLLAVLAPQIERIEPLLCDWASILHDALREDRRIILEGQLGALRDPDNGIYPFPTSSSPLAGFASVGAGIPPHAIRRIVAVVKAYSTCVGAGPLVTEITGPEEEKLRARGGSDGEYGATTGRPRRVGWFDAVATRYGCRLQGATELALTNLDVLSCFEQLPVCRAYRWGGERSIVFPVTSRLQNARPQFEWLPRWGADISSVRDFGDLPVEAQRYVQVVEDLVEVPIRWISVGPHREAMIERHS